MFLYIKLMNQLLERILKEFNADRLVLALIHPTSSEGIKSYEYVFSIEKEVLNAGIKSIKDIVQNKSISLLVTEDPYYEDDILFSSSELSDLPLLCTSYLKKIDTTTVINHYLYYGDLIIGLFSLQYSSLKNCPFKTQKECLKNKFKLHLAQTKISNQLMNLRD